MKRILLSVACLFLLSLGLAAETPSPEPAVKAAPAASCPAPQLFETKTPAPPFLTPEPSTAFCTVNQCRSYCPNCPGCVKDCVDFATCECECICS
ncbi:MAG TPA: hypothetical protein VJ725_09780 [Thermoanaerobaculia bacterium]|nr:hypothetical protein [Thermoanaerobaculia bacterium]